MLISDFNKLPQQMKNKQVYSYYEMLDEKRASLCAKRIFDIILSLILIVLFLLPMLVIAVIIKTDSKGHVFYTQPRITKNYRKFNIIKFRTMYECSGGSSSSLTISGDGRVTKAGSKLRYMRLDEIPQLFNILFGSMTFVGTRPEVEKYVSMYTDDMLATLLLPAGLTSKASILFRKESELLKDEQDASRTYIEEILPSKMIHNLEYLRDYSFMNDMRILMKTLFKLNC